MMTVRSKRVVLPDGVRPAAILVRDGRIARVGAYHEQAPAIPLLDADDLVVMPGLVDTHVHVNEPGRTHWEGFDTATRAAAAGGATTIVDMPLNSIPATTTVAALDEKLRAAGGQCRVDVAFWGGVVPGNVGELEPLVRRGVLGFKCFLSPSGVEEFEHVGEKDLRAALPVLARLGVPLLAHAELPSELKAADLTADRRRYKTWLDSRPATAEDAAVRLLVDLAREFGAHVHVVHLAAHEPLALLRSARADGVSVTVETCPHYLAFAADDVPDGATAYKCAPPIRSAEHRDSLWRALQEGDIDLVATDHSPAPPEMKHVGDGDFLAAWGGIASLQLGLSIVWKEAADRGVPVSRLAEWMATAPAALAGLDGRKGRIAEGLDADLVIWDPDDEWTADPTVLHHRHKVTPYAGRRLRGRVRKTVLRGELVYDDGVVADRCSGITILGRTANIPRP